MDSNLRAKVEEARAQHAYMAETSEHFWVHSDSVEQRRLHLRDMYYEEGFVDGLQWVLDHMDTAPVSTKSARPPSAADRIEAWLAAHPEDNALSLRELAGRVGVSKTAVDKWRKLSTSVRNVEPVLE